jgi:BirA family biotin operon repressor/biotin-[acetyl-CoA-carboxylase] ligase
MINIAIIQKFMKTNQIGKRIFYFENIDSTNLEAARLIESSNAQFGDVIIAKIQSAGKGQQDNVWQSPEGGLYISIITASKVSEYLNLITFTAGIACIDAIKNISGVNADLKWVNDIMYKGNKLGGILTQSFTRGDISTNITGIGINANSVNINTDNKSYEAISLAELLEDPVDINVLLAEICKSFEKYFSKYQQNPETIIAKWLEHSNIVGKQIVFENNDAEIVGIIQGVNNSGHLIIENREKSYILTSTKGIKSCLY